MPDLQSADFSALNSLWRRRFPPKYFVDEALLRANTVEARFFDATHSSVLDGDRGLLAFKRNAGDYSGAGNNATAHLTAALAEDLPQLSNTFRAALTQLKQAKVERLVFGQDNRHFFPGAPKDVPWLSSFLLQMGFEPGPQEVFDLERDLIDYRPKRELPSDCRFELVSSNTKEQLDAFLAREFSPRWRNDSLTKLEKDPGSVLAMYVGNDLHGFALIQDAQTTLPIGGATWRMSLGETWGSLGPIGISKEVRGTGLGDAMLSAGLLELQRRGTRRCIIDWTVLEDFYGAHGFKITRRYQPYSMDLTK